MDSKPMTSEQSSVWVGVSLNSLLWFEGEFPSTDKGEGELASSFLNFISGPFSSWQSDDARRDYQQISKQDRAFWAVPSHSRIFNGIVRPVHNAKAALILGHHIACIALCGTVCEMICLFRFEVAKEASSDSDWLQRAERTIREQYPKADPKAGFDGLSQSRRIRVLRELGLFDETLLQKLSNVHDTRTEYMHFWSDDASRTAKDAMRLYEYAVNICSYLIGIRVTTEGSAGGFHPEFEVWMRKKGLVQESRPIGNGEGESARVQPG